MKKVKPTLENWKAKLTYIKDVYSEQTGGGCMVDVLIMSDNKAICITDECVVVYKNIDAFWNQVSNAPSIWLSEVDKKTCKKCGK